MEILILTGIELRLDGLLEEQVYRLRHKIFVEQLGWEAIRRADGLENDDFDTDYAVHFLVRAPNGKLLAYSRLLPTTRPHLLANVYPHLIKGRKSLPIGPSIWEWTRIVPVPSATTDENRTDDVAGLGFAVKPAGRLLILAVIEWALANKINTLSTQCPPTLVYVVNSLGALAEPLARPSMTAEHQIVLPMLVHLKNSTPSTMRNAFGIPDDVTINTSLRGAERVRL